MPVGGKNKGRLKNSVTGFSDDLEWVLGFNSNCIFHPVGQKYQNSNQAVWIPFSAK